MFEARQGTVHLAAVFIAVCWQAELASMAAVPVLVASVNGLHLAEPPEQAKAAIAADHAAAQALPKHERQTEALKDLAECERQEEWLSSAYKCCILEVTGCRVLFVGFCIGEPIGLVYSGVI